MIAGLLFTAAAAMLAYLLHRVAPGQLTARMLITFGLGALFGFAVAVLVAGGTWERLIS